MRLNNFPIIISICVAFLSAACSSPRLPSAAATSPEKKASQSSVGKPASCEITIYQDGSKIVPKARDGHIIYALNHIPFRIEVPSVECDASIAMLSPADFSYIEARALVFTVNGYEIPAPKVVGYLEIEAEEAKHPRTTLKEEIYLVTKDLDNALTSYRELCARTTPCPTPIKAYRSYWPFLNDTGEEKRTYADITRYRGDIAISQVRGDVPVVVYTAVENVGRLTPEIPLYRVLKPHPLVLRFH